MKKITKIFIIISIVVFILGVLLAINLINQVWPGELSGGNYTIDGADFSLFMEIGLGLGMIALGAYVMFYTAIIILGIWAVYGIILLVTKIINKAKEKKINTKLIKVCIAIFVFIAILMFFILINKENIKQTISDSQEYQTTFDKFSLQFLKLENNEQNLIYSPLSIKYALKMLSEGAGGTTKTEIDNLIGELNLTKYKNIDGILSLANGIFIRNEYVEHIKESYKNTLIQKYNAEINNDYFQNAKNINNWIENKTFGMIKNMLKDDIVQNPNCKMLLINALALDMSWETSFDTNDTYGEKFYLKDGTEMIATTMNIETTSDNVSFYKDNNITALTMDLEKNDNIQLEFMAIMPENNLDEYIETVTLNEINDVTKKLTKASKISYGVDISIPKFSFDYDLKLKQDLKSLGIIEVFDDSLANLSNISDNKLYISDALHKANITFEEKGIKAAASTVFVASFNSVVGEWAWPEEIRIDKPFLFLIRDKETNEIWFTGTVYEPNHWQNDQEQYQK